MLPRRLFTYRNATLQKRLYSQSTKDALIVNKIIEIINDKDQKYSTKYSNNNNNINNYYYIFRQYWEHNSKQYFTNRLSSPPVNNINESSINKSIPAIHHKNISIVNNIAYDNFMDFILRNKDKSFIVRGFYRRELLYNINDPIIRSKIIKDIDTNIDSNNISKQDAFLWCLNDTITTGDLTMILDLYILYYKSNPNLQLDKLLASKLLSAITFNNPKINHILLDQYIQLDNLFQSYNETLMLTNFQFYSLDIMTQSLTDNLLLQKIMKRKLMNATLEPSLKDSDKQLKINVAYSLIKSDCRINNPAGVHTTWYQIENLFDSITEHDLRTICNVFKIFNKNKAYNDNCLDILEKLPNSYIYNNPLLLPEVLNFISKISSLEMAKKVIQNMRQYTTTNIQELLWNSKNYLSALLSMQLEFQDYKNSNETIKRIEELYGSLSSQEYTIIIRELLKKNKADTILQAVKLLDSIPLKKRITLYPIVIDRFLEWNLTKQSTLNEKIFPLINEFLIKAHQEDPRHELSMWEYISSIYIKYLVKGNSQAIVQDSKTEYLDLAKYIYIRSTTSSEKNIYSYNPWLVQIPSDIKLKITRKNRLVILRTISGSAKAMKRNDIYLWCCSVFNELGVPNLELKTDWIMKKAAWNKRTDISKINHLSGDSLSE
ncbi:hypothetical protein C6P45_004850 [Maudiozyma exigua]|uniref:Uncharacterized protein n=1 Tax=Maudiozyma exigua TaxID=34358 RepID=A0A9P6WBE7_MAUEX|nr:hypothetical protein C6P45_004850 [Kazachstania exigua]